MRTTRLQAACRPCDEGVDGVTDISSSRGPLHVQAEGNDCNFTWLPGLVISDNNIKLVS
eukprot:m.1637563 g.1637563  ORF g.1637563 m.1637563 type:complete len:59 (-) comp25943_c0_seq1:26-202(-)